MSLKTDCWATWNSFLHDLPAFSFRLCFRRKPAGSGTLGKINSEFLHQEWPKSVMQEFSSDPTVGQPGQILVKVMEWKAIDGYTETLCQVVEVPKSLIREDRVGHIGCMCACDWWLFNPINGKQGKKKFFFFNRFGPVLGTSWTWCLQPKSFFLTHNLYCPLEMHDGLYLRFHR